MKLLFCAKCFDIRAFDPTGQTWTSCRCGNMQAKWVDPHAGTVVVRARQREYARIIGLNNAMLYDAAEAPNKSSEQWRKAHEHATNAPGYLFDWRVRSCWAVIVRVNEASGVAWDPEDDH